MENSGDTILFMRTEQIEINGRSVLSYDSTKATLTLDISEGDLEELLVSAGEIPEEGIDLSFPVPPLGAMRQFSGVNRIERFQQDGTPLLTWEYLTEGKNGDPSDYLGKKLD